MTAPRVCPRCRGTAFTPTGLQSVRCAGCQLPIAVRRSGGTSWIAPVVIGSVVLALAIGGVIAWAIVRAQKQRSRAFRDRFELHDREARERREAMEGRRAPPDQDPPVARVGKAVRGEAASSTFWLVPYANAGPTAIARPHVRVTTYDGSGRRIAEENGYARVDRLEPGESTIVLLVAQGEGAIASFEVAAADPKAARWEAKALPATVGEWRVEKPEYGLPKLVGFARNDGAARIEYVTVEALGRNAGGEVVAYANGYVNDTHLDPGEESGFSLTTGVWQAEAPAAWEIVAHGQP